ncbi:MAG: hypothetical protein WC745_03505 [Patescibacteria group bacterium]|jgi:hypothetical protein
MCKEQYCPECGKKMHFSPEKWVGMAREKIHSRCEELKKRYESADEETKTKIKIGALVGGLLAIFTIFAKIAWLKKHYRHGDRMMGHRH